MKKYLFILFTAFTTLVAHRASGQTLRLAVAANAQFVISALQEDFRQKTGIVSEAIIGSSGNLATQIRNGAPYDLFLSADMAFPESLVKAGVAASNARAYALGSLIVCSSTLPALRGWKKLLASKNVGKIGLANPAVAPYGKAAEEALKAAGLWDGVQHKLVLGQSISQVNTYITTGVVPIGFTTESLLYEYKGKTRLVWEKVDPGTYAEIRQGMVILQHARKGNYATALRFFNYLSTDEARAILVKYGYGAPARK